MLRRRHAARTPTALICPAPVRDVPEQRSDRHVPLEGDEPERRVVGLRREELLSSLLVVPGILERIGHHRDDRPVVGLDRWPDRDPGRCTPGIGSVGDVDPHVQVLAVGE